MVKALVGDDLGATRSVLEDVFLPLVRAAALPRPGVNVRVAGLLVDACWHAAKVIVELDGRRYQDTDSRFESDRRRDAALAAAGYVVLRFTHRRLRDEPLACVAELSAVLSRRGGA